MKTNLMRVGTLSSMSDSPAWEFDIRSPRTFIFEGRGSQDLGKQTAVLEDTNSFSWNRTQGKAVTQEKPGQTYLQGLECLLKSLRSLVPTIGARTPQRILRDQ